MSEALVQNPILMSLQRVVLCAGRAADPLPRARRDLHQLQPRAAAHLPGAGRRLHVRVLQQGRQGPQRGHRARRQM